MGFRLNKLLGTGKRWVERGVRLRIPMSANSGSTWWNVVAQQAKMMRVSMRVWMERINCVNMAYIYIYIHVENYLTLNTLLQCLGSAELWAIYNSGTLALDKTRRSTRALGLQTKILQREVDLPR